MISDFLWTTTKNGKLTNRWSSHWSLFSSSPFSFPSDSNSKIISVLNWKKWFWSMRMTNLRKIILRRTWHTVNIIFKIQTNQHHVFCCWFGQKNLVSGFYERRKLRAGHSVTHNDRSKLMVNLEINFLINLLSTIGKLCTLRVQESKIE